MSTRLSFESAVGSIADSNPVRSTGSDAALEGESCTCGFVSAGAASQAYNEEAFRYFLDVERRRAEVSNRPFVLLLVDLTKQMAAPQMGAADARKLLSALAECVRETDFTGWYREGSVAGAVLTQHSDTADADLQEAVRVRIERLLAAHLPIQLASALRVRVYELPSAVQSVT